eukprot:3941987-Rhodomonas_salina.4
MVLPLSSTDTWVWCYQSACYKTMCSGSTPTGACLVLSAITLRACCAMSGTDLLYGGITLCASYAMSGTDLAYAARVQDYRCEKTRLR